MVLLFNFGYFLVVVLLIMKILFGGNAVLMLVPWSHLLSAIVTTRF